MFNLTQEEKKVILFLALVGFLGLGINLSLKINSSVKRIIVPLVEKVKLNINIVTFEELIATKRISKKLAQSIIDYRNINGPFRGLEGLREVKGVGEYRLEKLKEFIFVE